MDLARKQELGVAAAVAAGLAGLVVLVSLLANPARPGLDTVPEQEPIQVFPDFASIQNIDVKKQQFFDFLQDYIDARNAEVAQRREQLIGFAAAIADGGSLTRIEYDRLQEFSDLYQLDTEMSTESVAEQIDSLLYRVDVIPTSLVLAQAANESAWGTSRFTLEGFNLFGQWCFEEGCGIVPRRRAEGAIHEVKRFDSIQRAIDSYFLNINTHHGYRFFRDLRAQMRAQDRQLNSVVLAFGLGRYSERGGNYIDEVQNIIIQNELTGRDAVHSPI